MPVSDKPRRKFRPPVKRYHLTFEDPELEGIEVWAKGVSTGEILDIRAAEGEVGDERAIALFAEALLEWNVSGPEEDDDILPVGDQAMASLRSLDIDFVLSIVRAWTAALTQVAPPLPDASDSGATSAEGLIPMTPL